MLVGTGRRFPHRAFVDLAVAHEHDHAAVALLDARGERQPDADGKPVAERAGACLDTRRDHLRMAGKNRIEVTEPVEFRDREIAFVGEHGIKREAAVTLAENKTVAVRPLRLGRPMPQDVVVEYADYFDERERRSDVPALAPVDRADDQPAQMEAALVER